MKPEYVYVALTRAQDCRKGPGLGIMLFVTKSYRPNGSVEFERSPTKESIEAEITKAGFKVDSWRIISEAELPKDRTFRDAWEDQGWSIGHNMPRARNIHRQHLRKQRVAALDKLDIEYQQADELDDKLRKRDVARRKQVLRDITNDPRIEAAETPEELLKVMLGE